MSIQNEESYAQFRDLALPIALVNELMEKEEADLAARRQAWQDEQEKKAAAAEEVRRKKEEAKAIKTSIVWEDPLADYCGPKHKVFSKEDVELILKTIDSSGGDAEQRKRAKGLIETLEKTGEYRKLAVLPHHWRHDLECMSERFPNFSEVIDYVKVCCALAEKKDQVLSLRILLSGPPGTGKSLFSQTLAEWIGGGYTFVRFESAQSGSELGGSSDFWSNTKPGKPFMVLTEGSYANPTFFLDEIDKVSADRYDPLGPLYALLEPGTSKQFMDLSWPLLTLDCSRINYIAACNNETRIPEPLMTRLRKFHIPAPTAEQAYGIAKTIFQEEVERTLPKMHVPEEVIKAIAQLPPRRMRQAAQEALGRALYHERPAIQLTDVVIEQAKAQRGIGFLAK